MFSCSSINYSYANKPCLKNISLSLSQNKIIGLMGHNGCGKSTLIKIFSGIMTAASGEVNFFDRLVFNDKGRMCSSLRAQMGVLLQESSSDEKLSAWDNLKFSAKLMGIAKKNINQRIEEALNEARLIERKDDAVKKFSGGMRRRLELYRTFMHRPRIIFLDEPSEGLDHEETKRFLLALKNYKRDHNAMVIMSSHRSFELEECDEVIMMHEGKIFSRVDPSEAIAAIDKIKIEINFCDDAFKKISSIYDHKNNFLIDHVNKKLFCHVAKNNLQNFFQSDLVNATSFEKIFVRQPSIHDVYENNLRRYRDENNC